jgi:NAD(P)-dependent dehydrogenase (short-subunit alcohol dehydrogenase family)
VNFFPRRLDGKIALVTGAGSGIGRATAILMAREGAIVWVSDVEADTARQVAEEIFAERHVAQPVALDVTREADWQAVLSNILAQHGRLDVLVNNAGLAQDRPLGQMTLDAWRGTLAVNLDGAFLGTTCAIEAMKPGHGGSIVNVASVSGIRPSPGAAAYCTSKAAVRMFTRVAAIECADANTGIRVNVVTPSGVKTPMWKKQEFFQHLIQQHGGAEEAFSAMSGSAASHQFFSPDEVAQTILYLASDESAHLTGAEIVLDRGHTG